MFGKTNWADVEDDIPVPKKAPAAGAKAGGRWAEMDDDDIVAPSTGMGKVMTTVDRDDPSTKYKTEYLERDGKAIKKTTTIKTTTVIRKSNRFVEARKSWKNFGKCHSGDSEDEIAYGKNTPVRDEQEIFLEIKRELKMKSTGEEEKFWETSIVAMESIVNESSKKKWDAGALRKQREVEEQLRAAELAGGPQGTVRRPDGAAYVPPSMRGREADKDDRSKENTLRVLNLSEDAKEGDLHALFMPFGKLNRVFLAKHRDGDKMGQSKGFAFVTFYERRDAERAMAKLNGHGYDSLILQVTWAKPKEN